MRTRHRQSRLGYVLGTIDPDHYVEAYEQGAPLRAGFDPCRAFDRVSADTNQALAKDGRITVPCLGPCGEMGRFGEFFEFAADESVETVDVASGSG